jgi:hypothetical protein
MQGGGSLPTAYNVLKNSDSNASIVTNGNVHIGGVGGTGGAQLLITGSNRSTGSFLFEALGGTGGNLFVMNTAGQLLLGETTGTGTLSISDAGGTNAFGTHIAVQQTTAPGVTNATLDAHASDVAGTLTLTAANPVVTFHVAYSSVPHVFISSPSGTAFTYSVSTTGITITGGASGNTFTYVVLQ